MGSSIVKLYTCVEADVPPELRRWHVTEEEIDESLALLARDHAAQKPVERAEIGDSLRCVDGAGKTVLLYPGRGLPGAEEAEKSAVGQAVGQRFSCRVGGTDLTLEVREILRLMDHPVDDALVRLENIPGVSDLKAYRAWYIRENAPKKREKAAQLIAWALFEKIRENSELAIDEAEKEQWCARRGKYIYDMSVEAGHDPHIPDEGVELLSDEEALARYVRSQEPMYRDFVFFRYLSQRDGFEYTRDRFLQETRDRFAEHREQYEAMGADLEDALTDISFFMNTEHAYMDHALALLVRQAETYLED